MSDERGNGNDRDDVMEEDDERRVRATCAPACTRASATTASPGQARRSCRRSADPSPPVPSAAARPLRVSATRPLRLAIAASPAARATGLQR